MTEPKKCIAVTEIIENYLLSKSNVNENHISNNILSFFGLNGYFYSTDDAGKFGDALIRLFFFYQDIRINCSSNHPEIQRVNKIMDSALEDDTFFKHFKDYFGSIGTGEAFVGFFNNYLHEVGKQNKERANKVLPAAKPDQKELIDIYFFKGFNNEEINREIDRKNEKKEEKLELVKKQIEKRDLDKQKNTETCPIPKKELDFAELEANVKLNVLKDPDNHKIFINSVQVIFDFYPCVNDYDSKTLEKIDNFFDMAQSSEHGNIEIFEVIKLLKKLSDKQFIYMLKYSSHKKQLLDDYRKHFTDKQLSLFDADYNLHPLLEALLVERESKRKILREEAEQGKENVESENNKLELEYNQKLLKLEDEISKSGNNEVSQAALTTSKEMGAGKTSAETEAANNMETIEVNPTMVTTEFSVERESKKETLRKEAEQGKENVESENNKLEGEFKEKPSESGNNEVSQAGVTTSEEIGGGKTTAETEAANNMETIEVNPTMETTEAIISSPTSRAQMVIDEAIKNGVLKTLIDDVIDKCDALSMEIINTIPGLWENPEYKEEVLQVCQYIFADTTVENCFYDFHVITEGCSRF